MGLFTTNQTNTANSVYEETKKYLKEKNGNVHILMINSFSKLGNQVFGCEDKYTTQLNVILDGLQNDEYEIVDVKFNSLVGQGIMGNQEGFNTMILYK